MIAYTFKRLASFVPTVLVATLLVFFFIRAIPGDPAAVMLGDGATPEAIAQLREKLGLNHPLFWQYFVWLAALAQGDFGQSLFFHQPVLQVIGDGAVTSLCLASLTMFWVLMIGVPLGMLAASYHRHWFDHVASAGSMLAASVPTFWLGLYLILVFAVGLGWFPSSGFPSWEGGGLANLSYLVLPSLTLAAPNSALILRLVRSSMLDVQREDYIRTARAKGLSPMRVVWGHIFRNALVGVVGSIGFTFAALVSEAVVTETVFSLPGIGQLIVQSILRRDYPVLEGVMLVTIIFYLAVNFLVDLAYGWLDPRVKLK